MDNYRYKEKNVTGSYTELNSGFIYIIPQIKRHQEDGKIDGKNLKELQTMKNIEYKVLSALERMLVHTLRQFSFSH